MLTGQPSNQPASAQAQCTQITSPKSIPSPSLINFDDLANASVIADKYWFSYGVFFEDSADNQAIIYGNEPTEAQSSPNVAINNAVFPNTSSNLPMIIAFNSPKSHVGFYIGNGETAQMSALLNAYDAKGTLICQARIAIVPEPHTDFLGVNDPLGQIMTITLDYGQTSLSESIDDLYFAPAAQPTATATAQPPTATSTTPPRATATPSPTPTRTPLPTWTPVPTASPTPGPTLTPTSVIPMMSYKPSKEIAVPPSFLLSDLSIHGIEITQGIQCFDTSKGLGSCANNSLPVVAKKSTTARIYLKYDGIFPGMSNVPVRLYIRANGVWYTANVTGRAVPAVDQSTDDSADVYFTVNFSNDIPVDFYAVVDPNGTITETNENNNRYPSSGYLTLTFRKRDNLKIVGQRLRYHPSGYAGSQYAGGWAVNGGAADWLEQPLPISNNGINYSVASGYLDWTSTLGGNGDNQHALIQTLNANWILQNVFAFLFSGAYTGADHVYGWAPNAGYSGGHADMPVYPHAGGLGVVGIGSDNPGTNTDNPGSGALIFGHELVHDYDVFHTNTVDACGSNDSGSDFPYASSSIQEFGFNPVTGMIYDPASTHDLMSYCPSGGSQQGWISPFTWNKMYNKFAPARHFRQLRGGEAVQPGVLYATANTTSLVINATVFNPANSPQIPGVLGQLYKVDSGVTYALPTGDYSVQLRSASDSVLASHSFTVDFESEYDAHSEAPGSGTTTPPFSPDPTNQVDVSFIVPWVDGTTSVVLLHQNVILDQRAVSSQAPQVTITSPTVKETWAAGTMHTITWTGSDDDGDSLSYAVFYSPDGGVSWNLLVSELSQPQYVVDVDAMAGGSDVRFRVLATDGVNIGIDETDEAITIPNHAPQITILTSKGFYPPGSLVVLQGSATDLEDGSLPDEKLVWSSDVQGGLGIGPSIPLVTLQPGLHVITLTATDSYGISGSATVEINVAYPLFIPVINR